MLNTEGLDQVRRTLEADGFRLAARLEDRESGERLRVTVTADEGTCGDCLVPKSVLQQILQRAVGVPAESIDISYPGDSAGTAESAG